MQEMRDQMAQKPARPKTDQGPTRLEEAQDEIQKIILEIKIKKEKQAKMKKDI